jgi:glyoxylase-like metal-dependent hydrolase (beta-lactamase superfamily II)
VFQVEMKHDLGTAIELQGVDPAWIDYIVFSHLHFDHSGGTAAIPNARIVVQADEWATAKDDAAMSGPAFATSDFNLGHDIIEVRGLHDIFDDGSVVCIPTPGHTPGHQSLRVELASGPVVLGGDCCYWRSMLEDNALPPFGFDFELQLESMETLRRLEREGARLIFGHDPDQWHDIGGQVLT